MWPIGAVKQWPCDCPQLRLLTWHFAPTLSLEIWIKSPYISLFLPRYCYSLLYHERFTLTVWPFLAGCFFTTSGGLKSFEHPLNALKPMPRVDSQGQVCGATFKVDSSVKKETGMPRVGSAANWSSQFWAWFRTMNEIGVSITIASLLPLFARVCLVVHHTDQKLSSGHFFLPWYVVSPLLVCFCSSTPRCADKLHCMDIDFNNNHGFMNFVFG